MHEERRKNGWMLTGVLMGSYTAVLGVLVVVWWIRNPGYPWDDRAAALVSAGLFCALGIRALLALRKRWWEQETAGGTALERAKPDRATPWVVFGALLLTELATVMLVYLLQIMDGCREPLKEAAEIWLKTDSQHYLDIAEVWYLSEGDMSRLVQLVFLPGYPLVIRLAEHLTGTYFSAAMVVSAVSFALGGSMLYRLARLDADREEALRAVKYCCIWPGAFFFAAPMSESLFFLLSVSCIYCSRRKCWPAAGLLGAMAAFTRSLGLVLVVPLVFDLVDSCVRRKMPLRRVVLNGLSVLLVPLGFLAYCGICKAVSGQWFKFLEYQSDHWYQELGMFFNTAAYQMDYAGRRLAEGDFEELMGLWGMNIVCIFGSLLVLLCSVRRQHPGHIAYAMAYFVIAIGATWLLSGPRYLMVLFPVSLGLASLTKKGHWDGIVTAALTTVDLLYLIMFVRRWSVW